MTRYQFLIDTYETERLKTLTVWSEFEDDDLGIRPRSDDPRGRTVREHMIHQFVSEGGWFARMLGIDVGNPSPPPEATRLEFITRYADDSRARSAALAEKDDGWWEAEVPFFEVTRSRAWILVRRIAHTAHHRGQLTTLLRAWGRELHSTYGPTADTGGLPARAALTIYAYPDVDALIAGERAGGRKRPLPGPGDASPTELGP